MILSGGTIIDGDFKKRRCDIEIENGKIINIGENLSGSEKLDLTGKYILPGFIDTHIHGAYGARISDDNPAMENITRFEATQGVTAIAITTASSEFENLLSQIDIAVEASKKNAGAKIAGIHAEGPFLSKKYKGAMNADNILAPDMEKFDIMLERSGGLLKIMTVAPEREGAEDFIKYAVSKGIAVTMGHTDATYDEAEKAVDAGASRSTHTFNAMRGLHHREPGVLGVALTNDNVTCEMICDFVHLHPAIVKMIYKAKGADRIDIISDSGHAAGMNVTEFMVDGLMRYVKDGVVRLADGTIAGSAKTVLDGVKNLISLGVPLEDISKMASYNPAKSLKIEKETGSIEIGKKADIVVLDENYDVDYTFVDGKCEYKREI